MQEKFLVSILVVLVIVFVFALSFLPPGLLKAPPIRKYIAQMDQQLCSDSDGGKNIYVYGECERIDPGGGIYYPIPDSCYDFYEIQEAHCWQGKCTSSWIDCPYGCDLYEGRCFKCIDTDGGYDKYTYGECTDDQGNLHEDFCSVDGRVRDYKCVELGYCDSRRIGCEYGCDNGACNQYAK